MVRITLIKSPTGCRKCTQTHQVLTELLAAHPDELELEIVDVTEERAARYGILMTPAVAIDDFIFSSGKVPRLERLEAYLARIRPA